MAEAKKRRRSRIDSYATGPSPNQRFRHRGASLAAEELSEGSSPGLASGGMGMGPPAPSPYMPSSSASRFELSLLTGARSSRVSAKESPRGDRLSWLAMGSSQTSLSLSPLGSRRDSMELEGDKRQSLICEMPCVDEEPEGREGRNSSGSGNPKSPASVET